MGTVPETDLSWRCLLYLFCILPLWRRSKRNLPNILTKMGARRKTTQKQGTGTCTPKKSKRGVGGRENPKKPSKKPQKASEPPVTRLLAKRSMMRGQRGSRPAPTLPEQIYETSTDGRRPCGRASALLTTCSMYVCRKMNNSRARTGHQRGMGGRGTDDDETDLQRNRKSAKTPSAKGPSSLRTCSNHKTCTMAVHV